MSITVLDLYTSNLISAGEIVERPSSIVKELVENSFDAESTSVVVEIRNGGTTYIRVSDDGVGIAKDELPLAILCHATSKISSPKDLDGIHSYGFRGEALAAISSVSKMKIFSKPSDEEGACLICEAGRIKDIYEIQCSEGTTITVEELFFNVPLRRRYLKRNTTECAKVADIVEKLALSRPDVSVRFIIDGGVRFVTPGDGVLKHAFQSIYGRNITDRLIPLKRDGGTVYVEGYAGEPDLQYGNRSQEIYFVNGRYCKNPIVCSAIERAYGSKIPSDRFPLTVFNIRVSPDNIEVNVHPMKTEIKFVDERALSDTVHYAVLSALNTVCIDRPEMKIGKVYGSENYLLFANGVRSSEAASFLRERENQTPLYGVADTGEEGTSFFSPTDDFDDEAFGKKYIVLTPEDKARFDEEYKKLDRPDISWIKEKYLGIKSEQTEIKAGGLKKEASTDSPSHPGNTDDGTVKTQAATEGVTYKMGYAESPQTVSENAQKRAVNIGNGAFSELGKQSTAESGQRGVGLDSFLAGYDIPDFIKTGNFVRKTPQNEDTSENDDVQTGTACTQQPKTEPDDKRYALTLTSEVLKDDDDIPPFRIAGEVYDCYVIVELEDRILLVDKHAAHERIIFDELCRRRKEKDAESQMLLVPIELMLSNEEADLLETYGDDIRSVGFNFKISDDTRSVSVTEVPVEIPLSAASDAFSAICARLAEGQNAFESAESEFFERALYQAACKAAIKGGIHYEKNHIEWICKKLLKKPGSDGKVIKTCPHGRPVAFEIKKSSVERQFSRIE